MDENQSNINAKAHSLDYSGRLDTVSDLHGTVANFYALITLIASDAKKSEVWKMMVKFHDLWMDQDGSHWINKHAKAHQYIVSAAVILEFQAVIAQYVRIANNLEYRLALKDGKPIAPTAYEQANERACHVITTMNNLLPQGALGHLHMEPLRCRNFYIEDNTSRDRHHVERQVQEQSSAGPGNEGRNGGQRRDEARTPSRNNDRTNSGNNNTTTGEAPDISEAQATILKNQGVIKWTGNGRVPINRDILEMNGQSSLSKLCMMAITHVRYCRWGDACKQKHIRRTSNLLAAPNKAKLLAFVQNTNHVELATPILSKSTY